MTWFIWKYFDSMLSKIDKKSYKNIDIYYIGYITISDYNDDYCVNPLHLIVNTADGHIGEKIEILSFWLHRQKQRSIEQIYRTLVWD